MCVIQFQNYIMNFLEHISKNTNMFYQLCKVKKKKKKKNASLI